MLLNKDVSERKLGPRQENAHPYKFSHERPPKTCNLVHENHLVQIFGSHPRHQILICLVGVLWGSYASQTTLDDICNFYTSGHLFSY